jgi:hypothetical protein
MWDKRVLSILLAFLTGSCASTSISDYAAPDDKQAEPFYLGWYDSVRDPEVLEEYRTHGFNAVLPYVGRSSIAEIVAFYQKAAELGIHSFLQIPVDALKSKDPVKLSEFIKTTAALPFHAWYLADEPELHKDLDHYTLGTTRAIIEAHDDRPLLVVHYRPEAIADYADFSDYAGINYYPAMRGTLPFMYVPEPFHSRISRAARVTRVAGKQLILVIQGYGKASDGSDQFFRRLPTRAEARYMYWAAIAERPRMILYWARYRSDPHWNHTVLHPMIAEFRTLFPGNLGYWTPALPALPLNVGAVGLENHAGERFILYVNHGFLPARIHLPEYLYGKMVQLLGEVLGAGENGILTLRHHGMALLSVPRLPDMR